MAQSPSTESDESRRVRVRRFVARLFKEPRSLHRTAERERLTLLSGHRVVRLSARARRLRRGLAAVASFGPTYMAIGIGMLWMPRVTGWAPIDIDEPTGFIGALWQVQAAAVGLTVAVVIFAFQALASSRWRTDLREFARSTFLIPVVFLGTTSLLVDGLVLLGWGRGAPEGWAATWAVVLAALTLLSVPFLFVRVLRAIDPSMLRRRILRLIAAEVRLKVEADITQRIALTMLDRWCNEIGAKYTWITRAQPWHVVIPSGSAGVVADVRLRRLRKLADHLAARGSNEPPQVTVRLAAGVSADTALLLLPEQATDRAKQLARGVVRVRSGPPTSDRLDELLDQLHAAAIDAARSGEAGWYGEIRDAYLEMLLAFPQAWSVYGQRFDQAVASGGFPFRLSEIDRVTRDIHSQLRQAITAQQREIAGAVAYLPIAAAARAVPLGALGLSGEMLNLTVNMSWLAQEFSDEPVATAVTEQIGMTLFEYVDYHCGSRLQREELTIAEREEAAGFVLQAFGFAAEYVKAMIDRRGFGELAETLSRWSDVLRHWDPDPHYFEFELDSAKAQTPIDATAVARAEESLSVVTRLSELAEEVRRARRRHMFELAAWALRLLQESGGEPRLIEALQAFAARTGSDRQRVDAASSAIDGDRLSKWITLSLPSRRAHFIGTDALVLDTFVVVTVVGMAADATPSFEPSEWILEREQALLNAAEALRTWSEWTHLVADGKVDERIDQFCAGIRRAAAEEQRLQRQALVAASPDPERVNEFTTRLRDGYENGRLVPLLLGGPVELSSRQETPLPGFFGTDEWVPKEWFLPSNRIMNVDDLARRWGEDIAESETDALLREVVKAPGRRLPGSTVRERVLAAAGRLVDSGFSPNVVICPISWRLRRELEPVPLAPEEPSAERTGERGRHWVAGSLGDLVVVEWPLWPGDRVVVADIPRLVRFRQTTVEPEDELFVAGIRFFAVDEAIDFVKEHPRAFWTTDRRRQDQRAEELSVHGLLRIRIAILAEIADLNAGVTVRIPKVLQRD
jgi:hypothetical protein